MALTEIAVRNAKPDKERPYKLSDERGMYVLVTPTGGKLWRLKYRFGGKEKTLALGVYPDTSLASAREKREAARKLLANEIDPSAARKTEKIEQRIRAANTFETVAREWVESKRAGWTAGHADQVLKSLVDDTFPDLGGVPVAELTAPVVLDAIRKVEKRGALEVAGRVKQRVSAVLRYAVATGRATSDPTRDLRGALKAPERVKHRAALLAPDLPDFFTKLAAYDGHPQTKLAIRFLLLTAVRSAELRGALWTEIDETAAEWRIPAARMKMREAHVVPLSTQALAVLAELRTLTGNRTHLFPNVAKPTAAMSENTVLFALYRMGYHGKATGHGFRTTFSTILNEQGFHPDWIERQLAHMERNAVRAAYNRAGHLPERRKMMQHWADYLSAVERGADVIPFRRSTA
ncbi:MAG: integrase arm-type DNA-binding domain-containing protein [Burkholderiales bacterium]|nr:integrase arm-type DNA-binding domain-containing protein [Burkholderiales bacterium]